MTREELRQFINTGINDLAEKVGFGSGRITEFNSQRSNTYPFAWLESLSREAEFTDRNLKMDSWRIEIHVALKDATDSKPEQYECLIDKADEIANQLLYNYNQSVSGFKLMTLKSPSIDPFIKKHADVLTGAILSFDIEQPDLTTRCV